MKKTVFYFAFILLSFSLSAQQFNTRLVPTPQKVDRTDGFCDILKAPEIVDFNIHKDGCIEDGSSNALSSSKAEKMAAKALKKNGIVIYSRSVDSIPGAKCQKQAYQLEITPNIITLRFTSVEGMGYAWNSLSLLVELWNFSNEPVPCMTITDWPDYEWRGWMDDISRGPIVNSEFSRQQIQVMNWVKMNFFNYYAEHVLYNPNYPDVAPHYLSTLAPGTMAESQMANLQCFAHFEKTLRIPFYQNIKDTRFNVDPSNEETYAFLEDQIRNTTNLYPTAKFFNIDCDETESLGSGRARDYVSRIGSEEAYVRHIQRVYDLVKKYNPESAVLMWGDIVGKKPEMLEKLPKDMQYIVWSYVPSDSFEEMIAPFKNLHDRYGTQFWVASGVSHWSHLFPSQHNYIKNIANLSRDGYCAGARGLMNTAWDDSGESLFNDCWHAMFWAAEIGWNCASLSAITDPDAYAQALKKREQVFNENIDRYFQLMNMPGTTQFFYAVGDLMKNKWVDSWYQTGSLMEPLLDFYPSKVDDAMLQRCDSVEAVLKAIYNEYQVPPIGYKDTMGWSSYQNAVFALHRIEVTLEKSRLRVLMSRRLKGEEVNYEALKNRYFSHLHQLKLEYLRIWDYECTEYSRNIICDRYDHLGQELLDAEQHVFIRTYAQDGKTMVKLSNLSGRPIYYTLDGRKPSDGSFLYAAPFELTRSCEVKTVSYNQWGDAVETSKYLLLHRGMGHLKQLNSQYATYRDTYSAGGDQALLDGELGSETTYNDGHWQGYWGQDIDVEMDFGVKTAVNHISMRFMQNSIDWILAPQTIEVYSSPDGKKWTLVREEAYNPDFRASGNIVHNNAIRDLKLQTRYLRVVAKNPGKLPEYTPGAGYDSYLFCDEIVIE